MYVGLLKILFFALFDILNTKDPNPGPAPVEVQFFLNDLPGNDFNLVFRSLEQLHGPVAAEEKAAAAAPCYVAGLPGSMYTRIFPCQSVHLFHSSHCLIWRSKVCLSMTQFYLIFKKNY